MCMEKNVLVKKWLQIHSKSESKRQSMKWKHTDSPAKKKFQAQQSVEKLMLTIFWNMKRPITTELLEKIPTISSASYSKWLRAWKMKPEN